MANTDKNIIITPNTGSANANPNIVFTGANAEIGPQTITATVTPAANGTINITGSSGNLLTIRNNLSNTLYTDGTITANAIISNNITSGNLSGGNLLSANYVVGNLELRVGDVDNENWSRIRHLQSTNAYGFTSELGDFTVITDEEAAVKQAIVLADVVPGSANTLFGVSIHSGNNTGPSTGNEVWTPVLTLSSSGNLTTIGNITAGNSVTGNFFIGDGGYLSNINGANVQSIANANYANFAGQVFNANVVTDNAQPNITSLGNLTGLTTGNLSVQANITAGNINGGNLTTANYIVGSSDVRIGNLSNNNYSRVQHLNTSSAYGFNAQLGQMTVITNEELPVQQALILGDTDVGNSNAIFGISVFNGNYNFPDIPIWYKIISLTGSGNLTFGPNNDSGNIVLGGNLNASSGIFSGSLSAGTVSFSGNLSAASANLTGNISAASMQLTGNLSAANANLGNLAKANFFQGDGYLLTNLTIQAGSAIVNGNSNVQVAPNANVTISANGQSNVVTVTGSETILTTDVNITSGNINVSAGSISASGNVTALSYTNGNSSLQINNANLVVKANNVNNVLIASSSGVSVSGLSTTGIISTSSNVNSGNINTGAISGTTGQLTGNLSAANANLGNLVTANFFQGDGYLLTNLTIETGSAIINGNSNVLVQPNGNVLFTVNGTANTLVVGQNQTTVTGNLSVTGNTNFNSNTTVSNLTVTNLTIPSGGSANANINFSVRGLTTYTGGVVGGGGVSVAGNLGVTGISFLNQTYFDGAVVSNSGVTFKATVGFDANAPVTIGNTLGVTGNTSLGNLSATKASVGNVTVTGNITAGNINGGNTVSANFFVGDGSFLSNINASNIGVVPFANYSNFAGEAFNVSAANITGTVANANYATNAGSATTANTVTASAQPNITSLGTLTGLTSTGNVNFTGTTNVNFTGSGVVRLGPVANIKITGGDDGFILRTDGEGNLSWTSGATAAGLAGANKQVQFNNNNTFGASANFTFDRTSNTLYADELTGKTISVTGNANVGNISATNGVFTTVSGNGALITFINGANVSQVPSAEAASRAGTVVDNAQPNITSVGTLTSLSVSGNANVSNLNTGFGYFANDAIVSGNLFVNGNLTYVNVDTLAVEDPIIELGTGPNGAAPVANSGKDVGTALNYYDTAAKRAFMGWDVSNAEIAFGANVSITNEVVTFNQLANTRAGNVLTTGVFANTVSATGNITASYFFGNGSQLTGIAAVTSNTALTVTDNAQPNITSVGTLTSLSVSGNSNVGNIGATNGVFTNISGNGSQLTGITGANVTGTVANATHATTADTATTAGTVTTASQPNITSVGTLTSLSVTGNITADNFIGNGSQLTGVAAGTANTAQTVTTNAQPNITSVGTLTSLSVSGNANVGNVGATNGVFTNVSGNGAQLTGIVGANVTGTVANATYATQADTAATVTNNAQPNITSVGILTSLSVSGNITAGNINGGNTTQANYIVGTSEVRIGNVPSENWSRIQHLNTSNAYGFESPLGQMLVLTNEEATVKQALVLADATTSYSSPMFGVSVYEGNNSGPSTGNETWTPIFTVTGTGDISTAGKITSGSLSVIGNANIGNIGTAGIVTATGNIQGGNLVTAGIVSTSGNAIAGNVSASGNITANYFIGNGSLLTGIIAGTATTAQTVTNAAQPNITSVGTLSSLSVSGNANVGNIGATNGVFTNVSGNGAALSSIAGANVTGTVANATYATNAGTATTATTANSATTAGTVTTASQPNITSVGTLTSLSVGGNANVGNLGTDGIISATGNITGNYFIGNGSLLTGVAAGTANTAQTVTNAAQPNITSVGTLTSLSVSGNANVGNIGTTNGVFTNVSGNGAALTSITGANVTGQVANALVAGTVYTNAQPNITSVGTLTSLSVSGNSNIGNIGTGIITATGAITGGSLSTAGALSVGANANIGNIGTGIITATGTITGGNLSTAGNISAGGTLSVTGNANIGNLGVTGVFATTLSATGNANVGNIGATNGVFTNISGNGAALTNITAGNISGQVANALVAGTVYTAAQPNITSVGTLTSLSVSGTATVGNVSTAGTVSATGNITGNYFIGNGSLLTGVAAGTANTAQTVTNAAQPNITSVGTLSSVSISGNANIGNIGTAGLITATGAITGGSLSTAGALSVGANANIGNIGTAGIITAAGTITGGNLSTAGNISAGGTLSITGNANVGNLGTAGLITATGNIQGGNLRTAGILSVGGNANVGNLGTTGVFATTLSATGNANVGNLNTTDAFITGNTIIGGNLFVNGNLTYVNVDTLAVEDPIIELGTGPNGAAPVANSGKDVGTALEYFDTTAKIAFMGWDVSNAEIAFGANVGITNEVVTFTQLANARAGNLLSTGVFATTLSATGNANVGNLGTAGLITATGNITGGNLSAGGSINAGTTVAITSAGTPAAVIGTGTGQTSGSGGVIRLAATGNVAYIQSGIYNTVSNSNAALAFTTINAGAEWMRLDANGNLGINTASPTSKLHVVGTANITGAAVFGSTISATGNANVGNIGATNGVFTNVSGNGSGLTAIPAANISGQVANALVAGTVYTAAQPNITSVGTLSSLSVSGNANVGNLGTAGLITATGNIQGGNLRTAGILSVGGNANVGNLGTTGVFATTLSATGNANVGNIGATNGVFTNVSGNGAGLTSLPAANISGQVANALVAGTVYTNAQPNITSVGTLSSLSVSGTAGIVSTDSVSGSSPTKIIRAVNGTQDIALIPMATAGAYNNITSTNDMLILFSNTSAQGNANLTIAPWASANTGIRIQSVSNAATIFLNANSVNVSSALSVTGNANVGNLGATGVFATTLSATGNANVGNLGTAGLITATGGITTNSSITTGGFWSAPFFNAKFNDFDDGSAMYIGSINAAGYKSISADTYYFNSGQWRSSKTVGALLNLQGGAVRFYTNENLTPNTSYYPAQRVVIQSDGNVGIANTSPTHTLSITGTMNVSGNANVGNLGATNGVFTTLNVSGAATVNTLNSNLWTQVGSRLYGKSTAGIDNFWIGLDGNRTEPTALAIGISTSNATGGSNVVNAINFMTNGGQRAIITSDGNIGIGTTTPGTLVEIFQSSNAAAVTRVYNANTQLGAEAVLQLYSGSRFVNYALNGNSNYMYVGGGSVSDIYTDFNSHIYRTTAGSELMRLNSTGLGIGTNNPGELLEVFKSANTAAYDDSVVFKTTNNANGSQFSRILFGQNTTNNMFIEVANATNVKGNLLLQPFGGAVGINTSTTTSTLNVGGTGSFTGNVTAPNFIGNLFGNWAGPLANGTSNVAIPAVNGNVNISVGGNANRFVVTSSGTVTTGTESVSGTITGGNLATAGTLSAGGDVTLSSSSTLIGGYAQIVGYNSVLGIKFAGGGTRFGLAMQPVTDGTTIATFFNAANGVVGSISQTASNVTWNGLVTGSNVTGTVASATTAGTVTSASQPNITSVGTLTSLSVSGNANVGNLGTAGLITATGNIQGGNLRTAGILSVGGNANVGNLGVTGVFATTLSATGNANVGNIGATNGVFTNISGTLTTAAQTSITSVGTLSSVSVSGTATAGNVSTTGSVTSVNTFGYKNRIINGGMVIDQRNEGASVNITTINTATIDRFVAQRGGTAAGAFTVGRSTTAPANFTNSILTTITTANASPAANFLATTTRQNIEGLNVSDLNWGTASARTITISFWARCSVTGTYPIFIINAPSTTRSYVSSFTINAANTWEFETITVPGDTTGTWNTNTDIGISVGFDLGSGSTYHAASANTWSAGTFTTTASLSRLIATGSATLNITGLQLELGNVATSFDYRNITTELTMCQRYFYSSIPSSSSYALLRYSATGNYGGAIQIVPWPVTMRATPAVTAYPYSNRASSGNVLVNNTTLSNGYSVQSTAQQMAYWNNGALPTEGEFFVFLADVSAEF